MTTRPLLVLVAAALGSLSLSCKDDPPPPPPECGNGLLEAGETCEGLPPPVGCDPETCTVDPEWVCTPEVPVPTDGGATSGGSTEPMEWMSTCEMLDTCGDGVIDLDEECDDGDMMVADGCSGCRIDPLYTCTGQPSECYKCGDGFINPGEECDSGIDLGNPSPGCTQNCEIVPGWMCFNEPTMCGPVCGDGMWFDMTIPDVTVGFAEQCDDGNLVPGDGCDASCDVEDDCECTGTPPGTSTCVCGLGTSSGTDDTGSSSGTDTGSSSGTDTGSSSGTGTGTGTSTT